MRSDVAALYVDHLGPYPSLVRDWYDETRRAEHYAGPLPIVAHPPCGPWSALRHLSHETTAWLGIIAVRQVQTWGGVLEQPKGSRLFAPLPKPGTRERDSRGGFVIEVCQCDWGHVARKRTWLYVVGDPVLPPMPAPREPTHWCSGGRTKRPGMGATVPAGIKVCSAQQRRRTPVAFAEWLLETASRCRKSVAA